MNESNRFNRLQIFLLASFVVVFVWSLVGCFDFLTWILEAAPTIIGGFVIILVYRRFKLTNLAYVLIWIHAIILLIGAHYTYARVPLFNWIRDTFELSRNHYDRLGHFAQGFVPAIIAREVLIRTSPLRPGKWLFFIVLCVCLAISAVYELLEWITAEFASDAAVTFLATQGDIWDAQKDMALCLFGAVVSLCLLSSFHNKLLQKMGI